MDRLRAAVAKNGPILGESWSDWWDHQLSHLWKWNPDVAREAGTQAVTLGANTVAAVLATGGQCRWEGSAKMNVCWGGLVPAARGGTAYGNTFVFVTPPDAPGPIDPRDYYKNDPVTYANKIEHESNHVKQWKVFGNLMAGLYLDAEDQANRSGLPVGCGNFFEETADLAKGGYVC